MTEQEKSSLATREIIPGTIVRDAALRKESLPSKEPKDKGAKNDEHVPEGASPTPGSSEWTENLFVGGDWRVSANAWAGFGLRMLLICGTLFSVYQYLMARQELRVERTLQLVELWERPDYQDAQKAVKARLAELLKQNPNPFGAKPTEKELAFYYQKIGIAALSEENGAMPLPEFQGHFDKVVYFLNRLSYCVEGNICDREIADAYFRDYADSFWRYFKGYVAEQRKDGAATYAQAIEKYVGDQPQPTGGTPAE